MNKNNVYEVGFLVNPDLSQQEATASVEKIKKILADNSASVMSEGEVVNIELAYQIITKINSKNERFNEAYFSWIKFSLENAQDMEALKFALDKIKAEVFRYLITKTTADDEATNKFMLAEKEEEQKKEAEVQEEIEKSEATEKSEETETETEKEEVTEVDDLTKIEGIGPKIAEVLVENGIKTFAQLAVAKDEDTQKMIEEVRGNHQSGTWNEQAELARDGKWDELKTMQDALDGGVEK